jgi:ribosomal protein S18 acetylase RimI-like enzyme
MMPDMDVSVRPATAADRADGLLYESARPYYDAFAGGEASARRLLGALWDRPRHTASYDICAVAVADGQLAGVLAGFPVPDGDVLARRFLSLAVPRLGPWRWPRAARHLHAAGRLAPHPPLRAFYVDALAVAPDARRRGVARALLAEADRRARAAGLESVALDTGIDNAAARGLYEAAGFALQEVREAPSAGAARAVGGHGFVSYLRSI